MKTKVEKAREDWDFSRISDSRKRKNAQQRGTGQDSDQKRLSIAFI